MFHIVLYQPEIPPNTGNIIRLSANTGARLHLIRPYGFELSDRHLRRAGLDYHDLTDLTEHADIDAFIGAVAPGRMFACSTKGQVRYDRIAYRPGDAFLFGPETRGLPLDVIRSYCDAAVLRVPMRPGNRSLNLSNAVSVILYEALAPAGLRSRGMGLTPRYDLSATLLISVREK
jgi:tRNA (cytidine/uridine-2'-O-)-methyltransferase